MYNLLKERHTVGILKTKSISEGCVSLCSQVCTSMCACAGGSQPMFTGVHIRVCMCRQKPAYVHRCAHPCVHVQEEASIQHQVSFLNHFPSYFLRQGPRAHRSGYTEWSANARAPPVFKSPSAGITDGHHGTLPFYVGAENLNSGSQACLAST